MAVDEDDNKADDHCMVCLGSFFEKTVGALSCGHVYHVECITDWSKTKVQCPICKTKVPVAEGRIEVATLAFKMCDKNEEEQPVLESDTGELALSHAGPNQVKDAFEKRLQEFEAQKELEHDNIEALSAELRVLSEEREGVGEEQRGLTFAIEDLESEISQLHDECEALSDRISKAGKRKNHLPIASPKSSDEDVSHERCMAGGIGRMHQLHDALVQAAKDYNFSRSQVKERLQDLEKTKAKAEKLAAEAQQLQVLHQRQPSVQKQSSQGRSEELRQLGTSVSNDLEQRSMPKSSLSRYKENIKDRPLERNFVEDGAHKSQLFWNASDDALFNGFVSTASRSLLAGKRNTGARHLCPSPAISSKSPLATMRPLNGPKRERTGAVDTSSTKLNVDISGSKKQNAMVMEGTSSMEDVGELTSSNQSDMVKGNSSNEPGPVEPGLLTSQVHHVEEAGPVEPNVDTTQNANLDANEPSAACRRSKSAINSGTIEAEAIRRDANEAACTRKNCKAEAIRRDANKAACKNGKALALGFSASTGGNGSGRGIKRVAPKGDSQQGKLMQMFRQLAEKRKEDPEDEGSAAKNSVRDLPCPRKSTPPAKVTLGPCSLAEKPTPPAKVDVLQMLRSSASTSCISVEQTSFAEKLQRCSDSSAPVVIDVESTSIVH